VFLGYASRFGHALIDRRLYLPRCRAADPARRAKTAVPEATAFMTKPEIARELIAAALDAGTPGAFVLADALYGSDRQLRRMLEAREQPYVPAVRSNETMRIGGDALQLTTSGELAAALPPEAWHCHAAGEGAKGPRLYDWARQRLFWSCDARWELAAGSPQPQRFRGGGVLRRVCAGRHDTCRTGRCRRPALDDRDLLRDRQGRTRPRSLRGAFVARLASPRHAGHGGHGVPRQIASRPVA